ncbi:SGNH/GDSL hydrolase family protein [Pseudarthrobacter sulfonivorans]|uniref:SGNH/GDSL hydrolase family protein n=1 Tax=Pseudarthrobacter sulfonivorans TaxID=121292 RepID=UPI0021029F9C|nr:SGNH/GDSL hydrolase family protein [Pseudarthrobacter sulfonivorans]
MIDYLPSFQGPMIKGTVMKDHAVRRRLSAFAAGLATIAMTLGFAAIPAEAAPPVPNVDLVAVGDSYTAGTGAGAFASSLPCIQTKGGYVDDLRDLAIVDDNVTNGACHGALLDQMADDVVPSVMQQIARLTAAETLSGRTELVTLTAGANDIGVNSILFACAYSTPEDCQQAVLSAEGKLPGMAADLSRAVTAIHRAAPRARIAVLGYPLLFDPERGIPVIPLERQEMINQGTAALNATIDAAVSAANTGSKANAQYIDVTSRFAEHAANSIINQWIVFGQPFTPQTFHPTADGHRAYAAAVTDAVNLASIARRN